MYVFLGFWVQAENPSLHDLEEYLTFCSPLPVEPIGW